MLGWVRILLSIACLWPMAVQAQSSAANGNDRIFRELGLPLFRNEVVFLQGSNTTPDEQRAASNFFKLLHLKARPQAIDDPALTHEFGSFLTSSEAAQFRVDNSFPWRWRGEDQFKKEDTRQRFLALHKARILSLVPSFPIPVVLSKPIPTDVYKGNGFDLSKYYGGPSVTNNLWSEGGTSNGILGTYNGGNFGTTLVATPITFPSFLEANEADSRRIKEIERSNPGSRVVANVHFSLTGVRFYGQRGISIDTVFNAVELQMAGGKLGESVSLPTPSNISMPAFESKALSQPAFLNADLARIIAVKADQGVLQSDDFVRQSLLLRLGIERKVFRQGSSSMDGSNWPLSLPNSLVQADTAPTGKDVALYRDWMRERSAEIGKTLRLRGFQVHGPSVDLSASFRGWDIGKMQPLSPTAKSAIERLHPEAIGIAQIPGHADMLVAVAMSPNENWVGVANTFGPNAKLFADFELLSATMLPVQGKPLLVLLLNPTSLGVEGGNVDQSRKLQSASIPADYQFDVLGVKLGMDASEAAQKIMNAFPDYETASAELDMKGDMVMPRFIQVDVGQNGLLVERFMIGFLDGSRSVVFLKRTYGSGMPRNEAADPELGRLIRAKYGSPALVQSIVSVWASNPVSKARIGRAKGCWVSTGFYYDEKTFNHNFITDRCGEVLAVSQVEGRASYILYDSTAIANARAATGRQERAPAAPSGTSGRL